MYLLGPISTVFQPVDADSSHIPLYETFSDDEDEITMTVLECDREAQYLLVLLQSSAIMKLTGSETIIMSDYEFEEARGT